MDIGLFQEAYDSPKVDFLLSHAAYCRDVLKLKKGERAIIANGRVSIYGCQVFPCTYFNTVTIFMLCFLFLFYYIMFNISRRKEMMWESEE